MYTGVLLIFVDPITNPSITYQSSNYYTTIDSILYLFLYVCVFTERAMSLHRTHAWCPQRPEEGAESPGIRVKDDCAL